MKTRITHLLTALLLLVLLMVTGLRLAYAADPTVRAVLFYSPACSHCHMVIDEVLTPLTEQYGDQLQIASIDITQDVGQAIYHDTIDHLSIPDDRTGVPTLVAGNTVLVGSQEIPQVFPGLVADQLAAGGLDWPDIPGLSTILVAQGFAVDEGTAPDAATLQTAVTSGSISDRLGRDPVGNGLAIILLVGMIGALIFAVMRLIKVSPGATLFAGKAAWKSWAVAGLCLIGLGVSAYMAYVETTGTAAVCGPVGDCNTVQQSDYALLFGLLPIGVLGMVGYGGMLFAWAGVQWGNGQTRRSASWLLLGLALLGTGFSIYLTFLEPFVIGATCAWCLTSAVVMTLILLLCLPAPRPVSPSFRQSRARA